jgi:hypothetical protein
VPWRAVIEAKLAQELSAQRIYQDLVTEHGFEGTYYSVRRFVAKLDPSQALPVRRLECAPGEEAQIDFGTGAWIHGTTRQQVGKHFVEVERPALQPLPAERFPFFHEGQRTVNRDGHIEVDRAFYSVPPEYLGRRVWARWDSRLVRVFNLQSAADGQPITMHVKREPGRFSTQAAHIASEKISMVEHGAEYLLNRLRRLGPEAMRWAEGVMQTRGIEGIRVLQGLWSLTQRYSTEQLARACNAAFAHGCYRLRTVRALVERQTDQQTTMNFLNEHPLIRPLTDAATDASRFKPYLPNVRDGEVPLERRFRVMYAADELRHGRRRLARLQFQTQDLSPCQCGNCHNYQLGRDLAWRYREIRFCPAQPDLSPLGFVLGSPLDLANRLRRDRLDNRESQSRKQSRNDGKDRQPTCQFNER